MNEEFDFLKQVNVFYIATIDGKHLRVCPIGAITLCEDKIYIHTY